MQKNNKNKTKQKKSNGKKTPKNVETQPAIQQLNFLVYSVFYDKVVVIINLNDKKTTYQLLVLLFLLASWYGDFFFVSKKENNRIKIEYKETMLIIKLKIAGFSIRVKIKKIILDFIIIIIVVILDRFFKCLGSSEIPFFGVLKRLFLSKYF